MYDYFDHNRARRLFLKTCTASLAGAYFLRGQQTHAADQVTPPNGFVPCIEIEPWLEEFLPENEDDAQEFTRSFRPAKVVGNQDEVDSLLQKESEFLINLTPDSDRAKILNDLTGNQLRETQSFIGDRAQTDDDPSTFLPDIARRDFRGIAHTQLTWPRNSEVTISFLDRNQLRTKIGSSTVQQLFNLARSEWGKVTGLNLRETNDSGADIRIALRDGFGHYSKIGTSSRDSNKSIQGRGESMNIDIRDISGNEAFGQGTILHEMGHAIGLWHEHQNSQGSIQWNVSKVIRYFQSRMNWSYEKIMRNVLRKLPGASEGYESTRRDPKSIMHYPFPQDLIISQNLDKPVPIQMNTVLSRTDKTFVAGLYGVDLDDEDLTTTPEPEEPEIVMHDDPLEQTNTSGLPSDIVEIDEARQRHGFKFEFSGGNFVTVFTRKTKEHSRPPMVVELHKSDDFDDNSRIAGPSTPGNGATLHDAFLISKKSLPKGTYYILAYAAFHHQLGHFSIGWDVGKDDKIGWNKKVADLNDKLEILNSGKRDLGSQISDIKKLQKHFWSNK